MSKAEDIINEVEKESKVICWTDRVRDAIENAENSLEYIKEQRNLDFELANIDEYNLTDREVYEKYKEIKQQKQDLMIDFLAKYESQKKFMKFEIFENLGNIKNLKVAEKKTLAFVENRKNGTSVYLSMEYDETEKKEFLCLTFSKHNLNNFDEEYDNTFAICYPYIYIPNMKYLEQLMENALEKFGKGEL